MKKINTKEQNDALFAKTKALVDGGSKASTACKETGLNKATYYSRIFLAKRASKSKAGKLEKSGIGRAVALPVSTGFVSTGDAEITLRRNGKEMTFHKLSSEAVDTILRAVL